MIHIIIAILEGHLPVISVQTDFSLSEVGQTTGKPTARLDRRRGMEVTLARILNETLPAFFGRMLMYGLFPSPRLSMNF